MPDSRRIGVMKDCGQIIATDRSLYIASGDECWSVDGTDGTRGRTYHVPSVGPGRREWGYLGSTDKSIIGSIQPRDASFFATAFQR